EPPAAAAAVRPRTSRPRAGDMPVTRHPHAGAAEAARPGPAHSRSAADARVAEYRRTRSGAVSRGFKSRACRRSRNRDAAPLTINYDCAGIAVPVMVVEPPSPPGVSAVIVMGLNNGRSRSGHSRLSRLANLLELREPQHPHVDPLLLPLDQVFVDVVEFLFLTLVFDQIDHLMDAALFELVGGRQLRQVAVVELRVLFSIRSQAIAV